MASRLDRPALRQTATTESGEVLPCGTHEARLNEHDRQIQDLKTTVADHDSRLNTGDVSFAEFRKDIHSLTTSVTGLTSVVQKVGWLIVTAVIVALISLVIKGH